MMKTRRWLAVVLCLAALSACSSMRRPTGSGGDRNALEAAAMDPVLHPNAYALIQALRPHWFEVRIGNRADKRVYLDDMFLGGVELLRQIATPTIEHIQYFDGPSATQRWGMDHAAGVIQIRSRR